MNQKHSDYKYKCDNESTSKNMFDDQMEGKLSDMEKYLSYKTKG